METKNKLVHLDGIRALMAINVMLCHFVCAYYPEMYFSDFTGPLSCFESTPLSVLVNGNVAVVFFFSLSGFLVGRSAFLKDCDAKNIINKSINRYLRLLPVVVLATLFAFLTMKFGFQYCLDVTNENANVEYLTNHGNFSPSFFSFVFDSFFWSFVTKNTYINAFWTIRYELWGYIITLLIAVVLKKSAFRRFAYFVIAVFVAKMLDSYYCIFIMGLFVADLEFNKNPTVFGKSFGKLLSNKAIVFLFFLVSAYFACCPLNEYFPIYTFWFKLPVINSALLRGIGMTLFIWVSLKSNIIQKILYAKPLVSLGEVSFETYAFHMPLMFSLEAGLFLLFEKHMNYNGAALLSFFITLIVIYVLSFAINKLVRKINKIIVF